MVIDGETGCVGVKIQVNFRCTETKARERDCERTVLEFHTFFTASLHLQHTGRNQLIIIIGINGSEVCLVGLPVVEIGRFQCFQSVFYPFSCGWAWSSTRRKGVQTNLFPWAQLVTSLPRGKSRSTECPIQAKGAHGTPVLNFNQREKTRCFQHING